MLSHFIYEGRLDPPLTRPAFARRIALHLVVVAALLGGALGLGMWGYSHFEGLDWRDAFLNAAMLLGGMGPIHTPLTNGGKIFAGCYALFAGLVFIAAAGILLAPVVHRVLHLFHWEE